MQLNEKVQTFLMAGFLIIIIVIIIVAGIMNSDRANPPLIEVTDEDMITIPIVTTMVTDTITTEVTTNLSDTTAFLETEIETEVIETTVSEHIIKQQQTDHDAEILAKLLAREADLEVVKSTTERACVLWTVLNRVDKYGTSVETEVTKPHQFAWDPNAPVREAHLMLAYDVLGRWYAERETGVSNGRVLPSNYYFFYGDGRHNHFFADWNERKARINEWDYSLPSPYAN